MIEPDRDSHICFECDSEFMVHTPYDIEEQISFCPFCGSELDLEEDDYDEDEDEEDEYP